MTQDPKIIQAILATQFHGRGILHGRVDFVGANFGMQISVWRKTARGSTLSWDRRVSLRKMDLAGPEAAPF